MSLVKGFVIRAEHTDFSDMKFEDAVLVGGSFHVAKVNSLRAIVKHLFQVPDSEITEVEIPTGNPLLIDLDNALHVKAARYLDAARAKPLPKV